MTWIFLSPAAVRTTSKEVFSSSSGAASAPTGDYYLYVLLQAPDPSGRTGRTRTGCRATPTRSTRSPGGDAEIGIHGNNDASALGQNVSHGCIRMDNDAITMLAKQLPLGTPVDVTA